MTQQVGRKLIEEQRKQRALRSERFLGKRYEIGDINLTLPEDAICKLFSVLQEANFTKEQIEDEIINPLLFREGKKRVKIIVVCDSLERTNPSWEISYEVIQ